MPCYSPLRMLKTSVFNLETGKFHYEFLGKAKEFVEPSDALSNDIYLVPCNRCIGCRLDYARQWSNRMLMELADNPSAIFVTLTYDNDHVPHGWNSDTNSYDGKLSLSVRDTQLFWKRLRKHFSDRKIRYYIAGEYGPKTQRPHYHAIIFGLSLSDFPDLRFYKFNRLKQPLYISALLQSIWKNGFCSIGNVTRDTCGYTARYMLKKYKGKDKSFYDDQFIESEFSCVSRRPGIGMRYFENREPSNMVSVFDGREVITFPLPRRILDSLIDYDIDKYYDFKELRRQSQVYSISEELKKTDLEYLDYLDLKETHIYELIKGINVSTRLEL